MGTVGVVPEKEIGAEAVELRPRPNEPDEGEEGFLGGSENAFNATVGLWPCVTGALMFHAVACEKIIDKRTAEVAAIVGEDAFGKAVVTKSAFHDGDDLGGGGAKAQGSEGEQTAAVVFDDAEDGEGKEAEDDDRGDVHAPEHPWFRDMDTLRWCRLAALQFTDQVATAEQDSANGRWGKNAAANAKQHFVELASASEEELDVKSADFVFDFNGSSDRCPAMPTVVRRNRWFSIPTTPPKKRTSQRAASATNFGDEKVTKKREPEKNQSPRKITKSKALPTKASRDIENGHR